MKITYLGPEGSYSHIAAEKFGLDAELQPVKTIRQALETRLAVIGDLPRGAYMVRAVSGSWGQSVRMLVK